MDLLTPFELQLAITVGVFLLGVLTFLTGGLILVTNVLRRDLYDLARQTARVAQKGLAEDLSGLVGNASTLMSTINEMARTTAGIGIFLTLLGLALITVAGWLAFQIPY